ncbi:hypothetical protein UFOVP694_33 [uncultured Caudovirales phage]|uniref:Uncharacterized protein n=1 Tax=uncultured Caudovirales phage TaxID=2100421 RepID=A0A6J5NFN7_9CAUD|nr:hypothetical protein UFOVP694_33 [uncultured Caudovirales phage]
MLVRIDTKAFEKQLTNIANYSFGFLDGVNRGKKEFLNNLGKGVIFALGQYIDSEARANSSSMHHVYEWYKTGSPSSRLFNLNYTVSNLGLSINSTFRQSSTMKEDMTVPFYNKAKIMENGIPVVIKPKGNGALKFKEGGQEIFVRKVVTVRNPGGEEVEGSFERVFDEFMRTYFTQAFLRSSGLLAYLNKPVAYKKNFLAGSKMGKSKGVETGYKWIINAKVEVE